MKGFRDQETTHSLSSTGSLKRKWFGAFVFNSGATSSNEWIPCLYHHIRFNQKTSEARDPLTTLPFCITFYESSLYLSILYLQFGKHFVQGSKVYRFPFHTGQLRDSLVYIRALFQLAKYLQISILLPFARSMDSL